MQADILSNTVKGALLSLVIVLLPLTCMGYVEGDINSDGKISLQETIYSLQVAAGLTIPLSGTTINVPGDIPTIQQAIDAVSDGDTISIAAGTFTEALTINGKALVLTGAGSGSTFIDGGSGTSHAIRIDNSPGVLVENLTVQNGYRGIYATNRSSVEIKQVVVQNCTDRGINIRVNSFADIIDSTFVNNGSDGIGVYYNSTIRITGTVTTKDNSYRGLKLNFGSTALIYDSTFASTGNDNAGIALSNNSSLYTINSNLSLLTNGVSGLKASSSSAIGIQSGSTVTVEDSGGNGIGVYGASRLSSTGGITIRRSQEMGLSVSDSAAVTFEGPVKIEDCGYIGFLITRTSNAYVKNRLEILNCVDNGIRLGRGSSFKNEDNANIIVKGTTGSGFGIGVKENSILIAQGGTFLIESNAGDGFRVRRNSTIILGNSDVGHYATIQNNSGNGINVIAQSILRIDENITIQNNAGWGITADDGSSIGVNNSIIQDNGGTGVQNNINLSFGARSTLYNNTIGSPLSCDSTVLSRGTTECP